MIPCITCLKYPICASKDELECKDLVGWLTEHDIGIGKRATKIIEFEKWWDREILYMIGYQESAKLYFKKEKDHHQCLIARNL